MGTSFASRCYDPALRWRTRHRREVASVCNEWLYGAQIALREVAHHKATAQAEKEVEEVVERLPIRQLEARLDEAVLVIEGEVESIEPSPIPDGFSLHSPNYRLAVVRVGLFSRAKLASA